MIIKCEYKSCDIWDPEIYGKLYGCFVGAARISKPGQKIRRFDGEHKERKTDDDVTLVYFRAVAAVIKYLPSNLADHFSHMTHLSVRCGLKRLSQRDFRGLENLIGLEISYCDLRSLSDNLFKKMPKLQTVYFDYNEKLVFKSSKLLQPFVGRPNVEVHLTRNKNINAFFATRLQGSVASLAELMQLIDSSYKKRAKKHNQKPDESLDYNQNSGVALDRNSNEVLDYRFIVEELWASGRYSDFTITSGDTQYKVHRSILGMLSKQMEEFIVNNEGIKELTGFSSSAVKNLLTFIYTGKVLDHENAKENFSIAVQFGIESMKSAYENILKFKVNETSDVFAIFDVFLFAHKHSAHELKKEAFARISNQYGDTLSDALMANPEKLRDFINVPEQFSLIETKMEVEDERFDYD